MNLLKRTPLHVACALDTPLPELQSLIRSHPKYLCHKDIDGRIPLHFLCMHLSARGENSTSSGVASLKSLLRNSPKSALEQDNDGWTCLHFCAHRRLPLIYFQTIISLYCDSIKVKDSMKRTPLHFAIMYRNEFVVIDYLVQVWPLAVGMPDRRGYYPLHFACCLYDRCEFVHNGGSIPPTSAATTNVTSHTTSSWNILQLLLRTDSSMIQLREHNGITPLDLLSITYERHVRAAVQEIENDVLNGCVLERPWNGYVVAYWVKAVLLVQVASSRKRSLLHGMVDDEMLENVVNKGIGVFAPTILHEMVKLDQCPVHLVKLTLGMYPHWIHAVDKDGNLPLHCVASKSTSVFAAKTNAMILKYLLDRHPNGSEQVNGIGKRPFCLAVKSGKLWKRDGLEYLFFASPGAIYTMGLDIRLIPFLFQKLNMESRKEESRLSLLHTLLTGQPDLIRSLNV